MDPSAVIIALLCLQGICAFIAIKYSKNIKRFMGMIGTFDNRISNLENITDTMDKNLKVLQKSLGISPEPTHTMKNTIHK